MRRIALVLIGLTALGGVAALKPHLIAGAVQWLATPHRGMPPLGVALAAWLAVTLFARLVSRPRRVAAAEPTSVLRREPPAVAAMLADRFAVPHRAVAATLLDLIARGYFRVETQDGLTVLGLGTPPDGDDLQPYEQRVCDAVRARAQNGSAPLASVYLGGGTSTSARQWRNSFQREVRNDAHARGLSRGRYPFWAAALLIASSLALVAVFAVSVGWFGHGTNVLEKGGALACVAVVLVLATWKIINGSGATQTRAGRAAAAHWLGVRAHFAGDPAFGQRLIVEAAQHRATAYSAALGVDTAAARELATQERPADEAWSSFGGRWRRVTVRRGRTLGWGSRPGGIAVIGAWAIVASVGVVAMVPFFLEVLHPQLVSEFRQSGGTPGVIGYHVALIAYTGFMVVFLGRWAVTMPKAVIDMVVRREVEGILIKKSRCARKSSNGGTYYEYYLAIDDGSADRIPLWQVTCGEFGHLREGDTVRLRVTPNLGYVLEVEKLRDRDETPVG